MAVDQPEIVDFLSIDAQSGVLWLTISDHLSWHDNEGQHLQLLRNKLDRYLAFIGSGELREKYPEGAGRTLGIQVVCKYPPSEEGLRFLGLAETAIEAVGVLFMHKVLQAN